MTHTGFAQNLKKYRRNCRLKRIIAPPLESKRLIFGQTVKSLPNEGTTLYDTQ